MLCDTAGLSAGGDALERAGIALARQRMAQADLILLVFDLSLPWSAADEALLNCWPSALVIHNKSDLVSGVPADARPAGLCVSAVTGEGCDRLTAEIGRRLVSEPLPSGAAALLPPSRWKPCGNCGTACRGEERAAFL